MMDQQNGQQSEEISNSPTGTRSRRSTSSKSFLYFQSHVLPGSLLGPYRSQQIPATQFPLYYPTTTSSYQPAIYCRSLMSAGNGFPPWRLTPSTFPEAHFQQGVSIGDVGYFDDTGGFQYRFNIFYSRDDPIQEVRMPRNFRPIEPSLPNWKVRVSTDVTKPGSVIKSEGIRSTRISEQPLYDYGDYTHKLDTDFHF